jgi:N-formylglutamate amidohydrolase
MTEIYSFHEGDTPLLVSIPHDGRLLAPGQAQRMTDDAMQLPDTDWHVRTLYAFAEDMGATVIAANFSRYVVDLNRPATDAALYAGQVSTGLCPAKSFAGRDIYKPGETVSAAEQQERVAAYWRPYHDRIRESLAAIRKHHGYALLWDAHSIASEVPLLFPGVLPDLSIGTDDDRSCSPAIAGEIMLVANASGYSAVQNGRFRGGHITRNYGAPHDHVHAVQLELSQRNYMNEKNMRYDAGRAQRLGEVIGNMLHAFLAAAQRQYRDE